MFGFQAKTPKLTYTSFPFEAAAVIIIIIITTWVSLLAASALDDVQSAFMETTNDCLTSQQVDQLLGEKMAQNLYGEFISGWKVLNENYSFDQRGLRSLKFHISIPLYRCKPSGDLFRYYFFPILFVSTYLMSNLLRKLSRSIRYRAIYNRATSFRFHRSWTHFFHRCNQ